MRLIVSPCVVMCLCLLASQAGLLLPSAHAASREMAAAEARWRYLPRNPSLAVAMEWKKVLNSEYSELIRREVPSAAAAALASINVIEGIERILLAIDGDTRLMVLEGKFDLDALKASGTADGAIVRTHRKAEVLMAEEGDAATGLGLVSERIVLVGDWTSITSALDRAASNKPGLPAGKYDLWISLRTPSPDVEEATLGFRLEQNLVVIGRMRSAKPSGFNPPDLGESPLKLTRDSDAQEFILNAVFVSRDQLAPYAGLIRPMLETGRGTAVAAAVPPPDAPPLLSGSESEVVGAQAQEPPRSPGKIRIYGLDDGVKEIDMPPAPVQRRVAANLR